jgi:hypothetical protein
MRDRCRNPNATGYHNYGGRGIGFCDRWEKFDNFLADMGERPPHSSLDRIDVDGNYEPSNCRWASHIEQCRNMRKTRVVNINGRAVSLAEAIELAGLSSSLVRSRLRYGWTIERAVATPSQRYRRT